MTATDILNAWLARYDANAKAAAHGRPFQWDAEGNVTATSHCFDDVIPPMDVDEVEAVRTLLDDNERLRAVVADEHSRLSQELDARPDTCERCGGVPCSTCGECPAQGCWDCRCG